MKLKLLVLFKKVFMYSWYGILIQLFFCSIILASEVSKAQKAVSVKEIRVNLTFDNDNLVSAFKKIERNTDLKFSYFKKELDNDVRINGTYKNAVLYDILVNISRISRLNFRQLNQNISATKPLKSIEGSPGGPFVQILAEIDIKGKVTDESGTGLPGVNIVVKGTREGTVTDVDGNYFLRADENDVLVFSSVGYISEEVPVNSRAEINVILLPNVQHLQELVVIGYGTTRKENLTGSVSKVNAEDLENIPTSRVDQILQGRAPGVQVTQNNGAPGARTTIRIRGGNSIQGNNDPLFVIDGNIVGTDFDLNNLNPNDIQSIEILKDATAISIYGTRGANGVVLITTKSGKDIEPGKPVVTINTYTGMQYIMNKVDVINGRQMAEYANEDAEFRLAPIPFPNLDEVPNTDWQSEITRDAPLHNVDLSVAGQNKDRTINYRISGNYFDQRGIVKASGIRKFNLRTNFDIDISKRVRTGLRLNVSRLIADNNVTDFGLVLNQLLTARAIRDEDGEFTFRNPVTDNFEPNPVARIQMEEDQSLTTKVFGNAYIEFEPINNMVIRSSFGVDLDNLKRNQYEPGALPLRLATNEGGLARIRTGTVTDILNENTISYALDLGSDHKFDILGGFTWQTREDESTVTQAVGFSNDALSFNNLSNGSDPTRNVVESDFDKFQLVSWLGRANYILKNKYLFTFVGRVDGSSRFFGTDNEYGFFPSAAVAWRLAEEPFIQQLGFFDILKLRASYGKSGSQAIESFRTLAVLEPTGVIFNDIRRAAVRNGRPSNKELKWEQTAQVDIGIEASFFNSRVTFEADYYNKKTEDLLLNVLIPNQTGFNSQLQNLGSIRNQGLELMISTVNVSKGDFVWTSQFNISGNRNKVLDLGGSEFINVVGTTNQGGPGARLILGEEAPVFTGVEYLGTWKSQEEIDASGQVGQDVGGPHFNDTNGDGVVSSEDFVVLGSPQPDFIYGLQNSLTYKNWSLSFFIQGTRGNEIFNSVTQTGFFGWSEQNKYTDVLDRWSPENPDSDVPRAGAVASIIEIVNNSQEVDDGSHLRLKSVNLSYNFPTQKWGLNGFRDLSIYFAGTNLLLLSDFRLYDPEVNALGSDSIAQGFSNGEYPYARTLTLGIRASF